MKVGVMHNVIEDMCKKHNVYLWQTKKQVVSINNRLPHYITFCPECCRERMFEEERKAVGDAVVAQKMASSYDVFLRESNIPSDLQMASYSTFSINSEIDQEARNFGLRMNDFYFRQEGEGNAFLVGPPGVGKSHLTIAIARKLNDDWKANGAPKSVIYTSVSRVFQKIQDGFNFQDGVSREDMLKLLTSVDYLFLDDLGKESTFGSNGNQATNWKQEFLYELFDNRKTTFINTNLNSGQLRLLYDTALVSRMGKGAKDYTFVYPQNAEDKRELPF